MANRPLATLQRAFIRCCVAPCRRRTANFRIACLDGNVDCNDLNEWNPRRSICGHDLSVDGCSPNGPSGCG